MENQNRISKRTKYSYDVQKVLEASQRSLMIVKEYRNRQEKIKFKKDMLLTKLDFLIQFSKEIK